jgi:hypothetical protein
MLTILCRRRQQQQPGSDAVIRSQEIEASAVSEFDQQESWTNAERSDDVKQLQFDASCCGRHIGRYDSKVAVLVGTRTLRECDLIDF